MVSDLEQHPDVEIADLWPLFLAAHPTLQVPSPLTRATYITYAPTLGPWLMATLGLSAEAAQVGIESIWGSLVDLTGAPANSRFRALDAVLRTSCKRWATSFEVAVGYDGILFAYPEILSALQLDSDRAEILAETAEVLEAMTRVTLWDVTDTAGVHHDAVSLNDVVDGLSQLSPLPAFQTWWHWVQTEWAPAIARYGHYDPARQHEAPPGQELDALECRENARELLNMLLPGLGDETIAGIEDTDTIPLGQDLDLYACPEVWHDLLNALGLGDKSLEQDV
jgi:hypothetical protein